MQALDDPQILLPIECTFCKQRGDVAQNCIHRLRSIGLLIDWPRKRLKKTKKKGNKAFDMEEQIKKSKVVVASTSATTGCMLYTPVSVSGIRCPHCLVHTGSNVNIISVKDMNIYGLLSPPVIFQPWKIWRWICASTRPIDYSTVDWT